MTGEDISDLPPEPSPDLDDLRAWHRLRPILDDGPTCPGAQAPCVPRPFVIVCNEIVLHDRMRIVECGSAASTAAAAGPQRVRRTRGHNATVMLDDANRPGEKQTRTEWQTYLDWTFESSCQPQP